MVNLPLRMLGESFLFAVTDTTAGPEPATDDIVSQSGFPLIVHERVVVMVTEMVSPFGEKDSEVGDTVNVITPNAWLRFTVTGGAPKASMVRVP